MLTLLELAASWTKHVRSYPNILCVCSTNILVDIGYYYWQQPMINTYDLSYVLGRIIH